MSTRTVRRRHLAFRTLGVAVLTVLTTAAPAAADPAGPTNYQSEIVRIEPPSSAFTASVVGGDSFVVIEQVEPVSIEVPGYNGEPYLRYRADGTVERNRNAPATFLNNDRYGGATNADLPAEASADAEPDWEIVATDGTYAWHDHRAHWMLTEPPLGLGPGDQIVDDVIPLVVGSQDVELVVASYWQAPPSPIPAVAGGLRPWRSALSSGGSGAVWPGVLAAGMAGLAVGAAQFLSLPAATEPSKALWLLPLIGCLAALGAGATWRRPATALPLAFGGSVAIVVAGVARRGGITKAVLPTDLPFWLDRWATTFSLVLGLAMTVVTGVMLVAVLSPSSGSPGGAGSLEAGSEAGSSPTES
ncbi:MAG: hypothetical protein R2710_24545 [Acidimicrobiales bacterium]